MRETFLFLDTETTGFKKSGNLIQEGQGRVCQIAMILADQTGKALAEYQSMIIPNDWYLRGKYKNYYGLSYNDCQKYGVDQFIAMEIFYNLASKCNQIVAHNSKFDKGMIDVETAYLGESDDPMTESEAVARGKPWFCTMRTNAHISHDGKGPKLDFALKHYTGKELVDAHDAMADTRACKDIFFAERARRGL